MLQSKRIKDLHEKESSKLYLWWIDTKISKVYYDFIWKFIQKPIFQIKRLYQWQTQVFRYDYDFDGHCLFAIIEYKLKRLEAVLKDGHAVQENMDMKALRLAIKLAGRLREDKYEDIFYDRHDAKWGKMKTWFTPTKRGSLWNNSRPKANTEAEKDLERTEFTKAYTDAYAMMKREEKWLYAILLKYLRNLWD